MNLRDRYSLPIGWHIIGEFEWSPNCLCDFKQVDQYKWARDSRKCGEHSDEHNHPRHLPKAYCRDCGAYIDSYSRTPEMKQHTIFGVDRFFADDGVPTQNIPLTSETVFTGRARYTWPCGHRVIVGKAKT